MPNSADELIYVIAEKGKVSPGMLRAAALAAWSEMRQDKTIASARAREAGIDVEKLPENMAEVVDIHPKGAPLTAVELGVMMGAAGPVAARIGWQIWKYVLLPQIRDKFGDKAIARKAAAEKVAAKKAPPAKAVTKPAAKKAAAKKKAS